MQKKNEEKIELTNEIRERLKEQQKNKKKSDKQIANLIRLHETTYKNIIRTVGGNKFVKEQIIKDLAEYYNCTPDYLKCLSNNPLTDQNGREVIGPVDFQIRNNIHEELFDYFREHPQTCKNIYFLLCKLPNGLKENIVSTINSISHLLQTSFLFSYTTNLEDKSFKLFQSDFALADPLYADFARNLMVADYLYEKENYESALIEYIRIIYNTIEHKAAQTNPIAEAACHKIIDIKTNWSKFPSELDFLIEEIPEMENKKFYKKHISEETIKKIKGYLNK